jgi:hypothetical protein
VHRWERRRVTTGPRGGLMGKEEGMKVEKNDVWVTGFHFRGCLDA